MVSVQRTPRLSHVVLPEGTRRGSVFAVHETGAPVPPKPRLLERVRAALRDRIIVGQTQLDCFERVSHAEHLCELRTLSS
jgi:hypothetical protein